MSSEKTEGTSWVKRQAVGTVMVAGVGAAGGAVWHLFQGGKGMNVSTRMVLGSIIGVVASIGAAGYAYDAVFGKKQKGFTDKIEQERAEASQSRAR